MQRSKMQSVRMATTALVAAAVCVAAPTGVRAQSAMGGDLDVMHAFLIDGFERAKAWDVSLAEAIPDSALDWAPNPDVRGFAAQVIHGANNGFVGNALFGVDAPAFGNEDALARDKAALVVAVAAGYDWILEQLRSMPAAGLAEESDLFGRTMARWRIAMFALEHAMWTRGQLVPYLHAHGVAVPAQQLF